MKKIIFTLLFASSIILTAQEKEEKTFTLSGSIDTYFRGNISGGNFRDSKNRNFARNYQRINHSLYIVSKKLPF